MTFSYREIRRPSSFPNNPSRNDRARTPIAAGFRESVAPRLPLEHPKAIWTGWRSELAGILIHLDTGPIVETTALPISLAATRGRHGRRSRRDLGDASRAGSTLLRVFAVMASVQNSSV